MWNNMHQTEAYILLLAYLQKITATKTIIK